MWAKRMVTMIAICVLSAIAALSQDLGSANKLFGSTSKKPTAKPKTTQANPKSTSKKPPASSNASKSTPSSAKSAPSSKASKISAADEARFEDLIDKGNVARDDRDYSAAESAYKKAKDLKPWDWRATYGLGNLFTDQQRWEEAEFAYRAALKLDPSNAIGHIALSYVLIQPVSAPDLADRYAEAERMARRAIQLAPTNALAFDQLGVALELRGLIDADTENVYRRAIGLDRSFAPAHAHLGRLLRRRGLTKESVDAYMQAISLAKDAATLVIVAEVMQSEQRFAESEPLLTKAVSGDPKNLSALLMLGRAQTAQGKFAEAELTLRKCVTVGSNAYMPNSLLAALYLRQAKLDKSEIALMQAKQKVPHLERRYLANQFSALGDAYSKAGNAVAAKRVYGQAKELGAESGAIAERSPG